MSNVIHNYPKMQCNVRIVTVITCRDLEITPVPTLAISKTRIDIQGNRSGRDRSRNASRMTFDQLILRTVGHLQRIAYGQGVCLEFRE